MNKTVLIILVLLIGGCSDDLPSADIPEEAEMRPMTADDLDSLSEFGSQVSVSGYVLEQYEEVLFLDVGDGIIRVALPEPLDLLAGVHVHAAGRVELYDDYPAVIATEWYYDSTAVPVHSE